MMSHMSATSLLATINSMALAAEQADTKLGDDLNNAVTNLRADLTTRLNSIDADIASLRSLSDFLSGGEKQQIEAILRQLVDSPRIQALFDSLVINVNGGSYNGKSVITALASMDKEAGGEFIYDENGVYNGYKMTLADDGLIVTFGAVVADNDETGVREVTFATDDFRGVPAQFGFVFNLSKQSVNRFGKVFVEPVLSPKSHSNLVLTLNVAAAVPTADPVPDVDGNGNNTGLPAEG